MSQKMMCAGCGMKVSIQNIIYWTNLIETKDTWNLNTFHVFFLRHRLRPNITNPSGFATTLAGAPKRLISYHCHFKNQLVYRVSQKDKYISENLATSHLALVWWNSKHSEQLYFFFMTTGNKSNKSRQILIDSVSYFFGTPCV